MMRAEGRSFVLHYDPRIAEHFRALNEVAPSLGRPGPPCCGTSTITSPCPLVLRGASSDLLSESTAQAMTEHGPPSPLRGL